MGAMGRWQGDAPVCGGGGVILISLPPTGKGGLLVFAWNLRGDALNDVLNPRSR